ncbi:MAG TPA: endonuclease/exonuclease/phosphatase family protein [Polyangiaceae bacterium]|nr:endonuclease/exonuclease/phosphatase family protein [Polyangiaceae bacterium]
MRELTLVSLNAALGVGLAPYADQRLDAIETDLPTLGADVICLQEVWLPDDLDRLVASLSSEYPYNHRSVRATGGDGAACTAAEASSLADCLASNCSDVDREGLPLCAIANCAGAFTEVSMACQQCIAANQAAVDVENLTTICANADGGAASFSDQTGLVLLSRLPLERPSYVAFESSLGDRGLLSARLHTDFMGEVDVNCTHLAASLGEVPYTGPYGSWAGERLRQIEQMLERVDEIRADGNAGGSAILMGDMNCGPGTALARAASPDAFARLANAGFIAPYAELDGRCTFCENNPLNGLVTDPEEGALIDHVLVSAAGSEVFAAERVLDAAISVDVDGEAIETAHSDHYGIRVRASGAGDVAP